MHVVSSGTPYIDIDAYASMIALAELLRAKGEDAAAASSSRLNSSIPPSLRALDVQFQTKLEPSDDNVFTFVDLSDPKHFDFKAKAEKVVAVIDHHLGFEDFWQQRIGREARLEFVGAACTQVYELWQEAGLLEQMSHSSALLLACGILDNTLNLKAALTTGRDKAAYAYLAKHSGQPDNLPEKYFTECQDYAAMDVENALADDTKVVEYPPLTHKVHAGQLALWDAQDFIHSEEETIRRVLALDGMPWYMNLIDVSSGKSVFLCEAPELRDWLHSLLGVTFEGNVALANRTWLRKEIMKQAIEKEGK